MTTQPSFASIQYRHYRILSELEKIESNVEFKKILHKFAEHEKNDFEFWKEFDDKKEFNLNPITIMAVKLMRKVLGLTFVVKYLENEEKNLLKQYKEFATKIKNQQQKAKIKQAIEHEIQHEQELISQIKEERVEFISSIILGINDGLIELTGALVGFSLALQNNILIALTGIITGIAASLSMASSAYMQAKYEPGKNAIKAAIYTGSAYIIVVALLVIPFIITTTLHGALSLLGLSVATIIIAISYYTSILFERPFGKQISQMAIFSIGTAVITFIIGLILRQWIQI